MIVLSLLSHTPPNQLSHGYVQLADFPPHLFLVRDGYLRSANFSKTMKISLFRFDTPFLIVYFRYTPLPSLPPSGGQVINKTLLKYLRFRYYTSLPPVTGVGTGIE